jgi:hypothetical protein
MYTSITELESTRVIRSIILGFTMIVFTFGGLFISIGIVRAERSPSRAQFLSSSMTENGQRRAFETGASAVEMASDDYATFEPTQTQVTFSPSATLQFVTDMVSDMIPDLGGECAATADEASEFGIEMCQ